MLQSTLCLLIKDSHPAEEILLAMKKRKFGVGKWNGVGGKFDFEKGDRSIVDTAIRETKEEIGIDVKKMDRVGFFTFRYPYKKQWNQDVHVFLIREWEGEPVESDEMRPQWFRIGEIPFEQMWDDDKYWLPHILEGKKLKANFIFKQGEKVDKHNIKII